VIGNDTHTCIIFLQVMVHEDFQFVVGYSAHTNIGTKQRRTEILTRESKKLTSTPTGSGTTLLSEQTVLLNTQCGPQRDAHGLNC
jgi:hypothetical protein